MENCEVRIIQREIIKRFLKKFQTFQLAVFENTNHIGTSAGARLVAQIIQILSS